MGPKSKKADIEMKKIGRQGTYKDEIEKLQIENFCDSLPRACRSETMTNKIKICALCKEIVNARSFYAHKCLESESINENLNKNRDIIEVMEYEKFGISPEFVTDMQSSFYNDAIGQLCKSDATLLEIGLRIYGNETVGKQKMQSQRKKAMTEMKDICRVYLKYSEIILPNKATVEKMFQINGKDHFLKFKKCIQQLNLSLNSKLNIAWKLKRTANTLMKKYLSEGNKDVGYKIDCFIKALEYNWILMFGEAQHHVDKQPFNKSKRPDSLPSVDAMKTLRLYILTNLKQTAKSDYLMWDVHIFIQLRRLLISRLLIFNGRRTQEVGYLTIKECNDMFKKVWTTEKANIAFEEDTTVHELRWEQNLHNAVNNMSWEPGKGRKFVSLLIPDDCIEGIKLLCNQGVRECCDISPRNEYVFPVSSSSSDKHIINASSDFLYIKRAAGVDIFEINSRKLRHLTADKLKQLDVYEEACCIHLGHEKSTHNST